MKYWPGTNIKKSSGNAFDWKSMCFADMSTFRRRFQVNASSPNEESRKFSLTYGVPSDDRKTH